MSDPNKSRNFYLGIKGRFIILIIIVALIPLLATHQSYTAVSDTRDNLYETHRLRVKSAIDLAISSINEYYQLTVDGNTTTEEAQAQALEAVKHMRFGRDNLDYFWVQHRLNGAVTMIMHPLVPSLNDTDISHLQDSAGQNFTVSFQEMAEQNGAGYIEYEWQYYDDVDRIEKKIAYVKMFDAWEWVICTGVYINDIEDADQQQDFVILIAALAVLSLIAAIIGAYYMSRSIVNPILKVGEEADRISAKDLTKSEMDLKSVREVQTLLRSFGTMQDQLIQLITSIKKTNSNTSNVASNLVSVAEEINASAEEVASTSQAMSHGATTQTELINEVSEEIKSTTKLVDEIIASIRNNTAQVSQIALQTNILALNAGIEASRAGDYGRGFAVVAENIRKLSDQSKIASESITEVADEIAARLEEAFNKISSTMLNVVSVSEETAASAEEVAAAAEEVTSSMEEVTGVSLELQNNIEESTEYISTFKVEE